MAVTKLRFRFRKAGDLRFLSHHDLMRVFERMLRRAELPFRSTEGFHPKPKMAFASALALGIIGHQEVIEIEFDGELDAHVVLRQLAAQSPDGLELYAVRAIEFKKPAQVSRAVYSVRMTAEQLANAPRRLAEIMAQPQCWVERAKPQARRIEIRSFLRRLDVSGDSLTMEFEVTPNGTARPEDILRLLGLENEIMNGSVLERTLLEIQDEVEHCQLPRTDPELESQRQAGREPIAECR
jgi:radical SAM-linked protein